jgi:hypothetical protein
LINYSNEFLGQKKKIDNEKLKNKNLNRPIHNFNDLDDLSGIDRSEKSTFRKQEDQK